MAGPWLDARLSDLLPPTGPAHKDHTHDTPLSPIAGEPGLKIVQTLTEHTSARRIQLYNLLTKCDDPFALFTRLHSREALSGQHKSPEVLQEIAMMYALRPRLHFCGYTYHLNARKTLAGGLSNDPMSFTEKSKKEKREVRTAAGREARSAGGCHDPSSSWQQRFGRCSIRRSRDETSRQTSRGRTPPSARTPASASAPSSTPNREASLRRRGLLTRCTTITVGAARKSRAVDMECDVVHESSECESVQRRKNVPQDVDYGSMGACETTYDDLTLWAVLTGQHALAKARSPELEPLESWAASPMSSRQARAYPRPVASQIVEASLAMACCPASRGPSREP